MENSGIYIGSLNGVVLCIDEKGKRDITGRVYHKYSKEAIIINSMETLLVSLDRFYDELGIPFPDSNHRTFVPQAECSMKANFARRERMNKVMSDKELLEKHGDFGTFIIRVQHRQHSSWQGMVTWVDEDKTVSFRSALELIKLIDGAINPKTPAGITEETEFDVTGNSLVDPQQTAGSEEAEDR